MTAACMNAVPNPTGGWLRCGWMGQVECLSQECPRCLSRGKLAPVVEASGADELEGEE